MIVDLKNISAGYDGDVVIEDVNFSIFNDDFIGVIGPNGGGKTTLLKTLLGVIKPYSGDLIWGGYCDRHGFKENECSDCLDVESTVSYRDLVGYLPQINSIDKQFPISVKDVVLSGLIGSGRILGKVTAEERNFAYQLLKQIGIEDLADRSISRLSGGQAQKAFLCRALIKQPKLLVLDEPTTYVDASTEGALYEILNELNRDIAIMVVSHDIGTISSHVKKLLCVNRKVHIHDSSEVDQTLLDHYNCPLEIISHGDVPHRVLKTHN